jgi:hypothetical protein
MSKKAQFEHLFAVDEDHGIRANLVYLKIEDEIIGCFFGYEGGGSYSDGSFWINKDWELFLKSDASEFPEHLSGAFEDLIAVRDSFGGYDPETLEEGWPSDAGWKLAESDNVEEYDEHWEYRSDNFDEDVINLVSGDWGLSMRWN